MSRARKPPVPSLTPATRLQQAALALRLGAVLQCATLAYLAFEHGTSLDSLLFMHVETGEAIARGADQALSLLAVLAALLLVAGRVTPAAVLVAVLFLVNAVAVAVVGGRAYAELAAFAHATRWLAPLALLSFWRAGNAGGTALRTGTWILRIAVATTFATHGFEALQAQPAFLDLLIGASRRWLESAPSEAAAGRVLLAIGLLDLLVALLVLITRRPTLFAWAALWGLLTLASRTVALGPEFLHESLLRCMNAVAPFSLWWVLRHPARDESP